MARWRHRNVARVYDKVENEMNSALKAEIGRVCVRSRNVCLEWKTLLRRWPLQCAGRRGVRCGGGGEHGRGGKVGGSGSRSRKSFLESRGSVIRKLEFETRFSCWGVVGVVEGGVRLWRPDTWTLAVTPAVKASSHVICDEHFFHNGTQRSTNHLSLKKHQKQHETEHITHPYNTTKHVTSPTVRERRGADR